MEAIAGTHLRRAADAIGAALAALLGGLPLLFEGHIPPLEGGLALAASLTALEALIFAPRLLAAALALYMTEFVISVHRRELPFVAVPFLAVGLLLLFEAGELSFQLPPDSIIEARALRALTKRLALTVALGLLASAIVLGAASLQSGGGSAAAIVGGLAVLAIVLLIRSLAGHDLG